MTIRFRTPPPVPPPARLRNSPSKRPTIHESSSSAHATFPPPLLRHPLMRTLAAQMFPVALLPHDIAYRLKRMPLHVELSKPQFGKSTFMCNVCAATFPAWFSFHPNWLSLLLPPYCILAKVLTGAAEPLGFPKRRRRYEFPAVLLSSADGPSGVEQSRLGGDSRRGPMLRIKRGVQSLRCLAEVPIN